MKKTLKNLVVVSALALAGAAWASPPTEPQRRSGTEPTNDKIVRDRVQPGSARHAAVREKTYDFTGDKIDGDRALPLGDALTARGELDHESLIRWRAHFLPELLKSAENL